MSPIHGLVHRYPDRVLIKLVAACAVYCRFCFRRERVGPGSGALSAADFAAALDYIRARPGVWEVILTGGDPLTLSSRRIGEATRALAAIAHVKMLRWHTRLPVAAPGAGHKSDGARARRRRQDDRRRHSRQPSARTHRRRTRRLPPPSVRRSNAGQPERAPERRQRRSGDPHRPDARFRRGAGQALLPASRRPRARHGALARADRERDRN